MQVTVKETTYTRTAVEIDARLHGHAGWKKGGRNNTLRGRFRNGHWMQLILTTRGAIILTETTAGMVRSAYMSSRYIQNL